MIFSRLSSALKYEGLDERLKSALNFLANNDFRGALVGRYEIDGDKLFYLILEYETRSKAISKLEGHRKYIDIQFIESGFECLGYAPLEGSKIFREYDLQNDYALYDGEASFLAFNEGMVAIFFPDDLHMPCIGDGSQKVKKIVMKLRLDDDWCGNA